MTESPSHPYPPDLQELLQSRSSMHYETMQDRGWDADADHLVGALGLDKAELDDDVMDNLVRAFEMGTDNGMMKMANLANRHCVRNYTELRFTDEASLNDALHDRYAGKYEVHTITEHDDGTATVTLSRTWSEMEEDGLQFYRIDGAVEAAAVPYGDGYAVDFEMDRPELLTRFENERRRNPDCVTEVDLFDSTDETSRQEGDHDLDPDADADETSS